MGCRPVELEGGMGARVACLERWGTGGMFSMGGGGGGGVSGRREKLNYPSWERVEVRLA